MPPALVKLPPAGRAGPVPSSYTARAQAGPSSPIPNPDQLEPSHFARYLVAGAPPALWNSPPAKSSAPPPSSYSARTRGGLDVPLPSADQVEPSHFAIRFAGTPPALVKKPP